MSIKNGDGNRAVSVFCEVSELYGGRFDCACGSAQRGS